MHETRSLARRTFFAWLLVALSLASALEIHPAGETLASAATGQTLAIPASAHPVTSTHVEGSTVREVPPCPACLLRLQTRGMRQIAAARVALPALAARVVAVGASPHEWRPTRPSAARAPPLA